MVEVIGYDELTGYPICKGEPDGTTYEQGRVDAINECIKTVHDYFCKLLDEHKEWEIDSIDDFALIPNKNICKALEQLKEQNEC